MADPTYRVALCCNDANGANTGRFVAVNVNDESDGDLMLELERYLTRGLALRRAGATLFVAGKRFRLLDASWSTWVGNIYWDACRMGLGEAERLAEFLLSRGFNADQVVIGCPFEEIVDKAEAAHG